MRRGFSGAPVFDEMGNTIWGMVVTVETDPGIYVAFSIPAEDLREALRPVLSERPDTDQVQERAPEPLDEIARDAMTALRQEYEQRLAEQREAYEQRIQEMRQAVQTVTELAREPATEAPATAALEQLKQGDIDLQSEFSKHSSIRRPRVRPKSGSRQRHWREASACSPTWTTQTGRSGLTRWRRASIRTTSGVGSTWPD